MRKSALAGLFACAVIIAANGSSASAENLDLLKSSGLKTESPAFNIIALGDIRNEQVQLIEEKPTTVPPAKEHVIEPNETLSTIASQHGTTWIRLFNKNEKISNPDVINAGDKVIIPLPEEQLAERPLPTPPPAVVEEPVSTGSTQTQPAQPAARSTGYAPRGSASGNTYTAGYCTWYVKNMRPDLPNSLGNADTWVARAAAQGLPTGSAPQVGAVGQQGMHVVYVEAVNANGTVTISEMNYEGLYVVSRRTVPASTFRYIY